MATLKNLASGIGDLSFSATEHSIWNAEACFWNPQPQSQVLKLAAFWNQQPKSLALKLAAFWTKNLWTSKPLKPAA
jgi:hypothetical protein